MPKVALPKPFPITRLPRPTIDPVFFAVSLAVSLRVGLRGRVKGEDDLLEGRELRFISTSIGMVSSTSFENLVILTSWDCGEAPAEEAASLSEREGAGEGDTEERYDFEKLDVEMLSSSSSDKI